MAIRKYIKSSPIFCHGKKKNKKEFQKGIVNVSHFQNKIHSSIICTFTKRERGSWVLTYGKRKSNGPISHSLNSYGLFPWSWRSMESINKREQKGCLPFSRIRKRREWLFKRLCKIPTTNVGPFGYWRYTQGAGEGVDPAQKLTRPKHAFSDAEWHGDQCLLKSFCSEWRKRVSDFYLSNFNHFI